MKLLASMALFCAVAAYAQRGGGMGGARGGLGGGMRAPGIGIGGRGGLGAPGFGRGFGGRAGFPSTFHAPFIRGGRGFFGRGASFGIGWSGLGWGWGWGLGNYGCPYSYPCTSSYATYPYVGGYWPGYSDVAPLSYGYSNPSPAVTVVYPPAQVQVERAHPVTREYDESGREIQSPAPPTASPIYLFAFEDQTIRAASSYRMEGSTLHYVTLQNEEKQAPLDSLDRSLTMQLNRERRVTIRLP